MGLQLKKYVKTARPDQPWMMLDFSNGSVKSLKELPFDVPKEPPPNIERRFDKREFDGMELKQLHQYMADVETYRELMADPELPEYVKENIRKLWNERGTLRTEVL